MNNQDEKDNIPKTKPPPPVYNTITNTNTVPMMYPPPYPSTHPYPVPNMSSVPPPVFPQMFYYQPFRPPAPHPFMAQYPQNLYPQMYPVPMYQTAAASVPHMNHHTAPSKPQNETVVGLKSQNQTVQVKTNTNILQPKSNQPKSFNSTPRPRRQPQSNISYNLDDPEELEKWKAERRKKFPGSKKEAESDIKKELDAEEDKEATAESVTIEIENVSACNQSDEEGALMIDEEDSIKLLVPEKKQRKRTCKFFARGHCSKGDSCPFEHTINTSRNTGKKVKIDKSDTSRPTVFENLLKIEEKEMMIKFYECIKSILK